MIISASFGAEIVASGTYPFGSHASPLQLPFVVVFQQSAPTRRMIALQPLKLINEMYVLLKWRCLTF